MSDPSKSQKNYHYSRQKIHWRVIDKQLEYKNSGILSASIEDRHGGVKARQWRRKIGLLSQAKAKHQLRTLTFPLAESPEISFDDATRLYAATEGLGKGSLIGLICALHLAGFRVFQNRSAAFEYRNMREIVDKIREFFNVHYDLNINNDQSFFIHSFATSLSRLKDRREFNESKIADLLCRHIASKGINSIKDENLKNFCNQLGTDVLKRFSNWDELNRDDFLKWADTYFRSKHHDFPNILNTIDQSIDSDVCIAFDSKRQYLFNNLTDEDIEFYGLHMVVACYAGEKKLTKAIVSFKNNAINWLFGKGLGFLRQNSPEKLMVDFDIPSTHYSVVQRLIEYAKALPITETGIPLLGKHHFGIFRQSTSGKVSSWVSNYHKRLNELKDYYANDKSLESIKMFLALYHELELDSEKMSFFDGLEMDWTVLIDARENYQLMNSEGSASLSRLLGETTSVDVSDAKKIEEIRSTLSTYFGSMAKIQARVRQIDEAPEKSEIFADLSHLIYEILTQEIAEPPKALPKISGGSVNLADFGVNATDRLNKLIRIQDHFLENAYRLDTFNVLSLYTKQEKQNANAHKNIIVFTEIEWQELGAKRFL
jgi:hypothetical protein